MSPGLFWRLALVLPPLVFVVLAALLGLLIALIDPPPQQSVLSGAAAFFMFVTFTSVIVGVWPAYAIWAGLYLWLTRGLSNARRRALSWLAPLTFAPICVAFWYAAGFLLRANAAPARVEGVALLIVATLILGYLSICIALILERLFRRLGWITVPHQTAPSEKP